MKSDFQRHLAKSAVMHKIPQIAVSALLLIHGRFNPHFDLPTDARTLLRIPRQAHIVDMKPGKFFYCGLDSGILDFLKHQCDGKSVELRIQVSTDGLPIANSGGGQFWPLMGRITISTTVLSIGCYYGKSKPKSSNKYLPAFIEEI